MVVQEKVNDRTDSSLVSSGNSRHDGDGIAHQIVSLVELQTELLGQDLRDGYRSLIRCLVLGASAVAASLAVSCVGLMFLAELLADVTRLPRSAAYGIATLAGVLLVAGLGLAAWSRLRASFHVFDRTRDEWRNTLAWFRTIRSARAEPTTDGQKEPDTPRV